MSENSRREHNQNPRQPEEFGKSRDQVEQPKGKFEDLFSTSQSIREHSTTSNTERPPESNSSGQVTPSQTEAPADE